MVLKHVKHARLLNALTQVKMRNTSQNLLNEIKTNSLFSVLVKKYY